jgi:hypothetical protein
VSAHWDGTADTEAAIKKKPKRLFAVFLSMLKRKRVFVFIVENLQK